MQQLPCFNPLEAGGQGDPAENFMLCDRLGGSSRGCYAGGAVTYPAVREQGGAR